MSKIKEIIAREIKDSRGRPTIEVELETDKGSFVAGVPSGASTGENEALELRDSDGKGVTTAIKNVNEIIAPKLKGKDVLNQKELDDFLIALDGTENKSKLGANAIIGVSMAICRAGAAAKKVFLYKHISELAGVKLADKIPLPMFNFIEGGAHVEQTNGGLLDFQEFLVVPQKKLFAENFAIGSKIYQKLEKFFKEKDFDDLVVGDEGGFGGVADKPEQALYILKNAIGDSDAQIALDCAASQLYRDGKYFMFPRDFSGYQSASTLKYDSYTSEELREMFYTHSDLLNMYKDLVAQFPIISIEDPFDQNDWNGWQVMMREMGDKTLIVGDDLTTTNIKRIKEAHNKNACNGVILKVNQIGTVSETIYASNMAKSFGWKTIVSHRSGETMDNFIADLAVGLQADYLKAGSPAKPERMAKYQRLLEIEQEIK